jgi:hypothetical protein
MRMWLTAFVCGVIVYAYPLTAWPHPSDLGRAREMLVLAKKLQGHREAIVDMGPALDGADQESESILYEIVSSIQDQLLFFSDLLGLRANMVAKADAESVTYVIRDEKKPFSEECNHDVHELNARMASEHNAALISETQEQKSVVADACSTVAALQ